MPNGAIWALVTAWALVMFYQHIRISWPENYFGPVDHVSYYFTRHGARYMLFRFAPPFAAFSLVGIYGSTNVVTLSAVLYILYSVGVSALGSISRAHGSTPLTAQRLGVLAITATCTALSAWAAIKLAPSLAEYAPPFSGIISDLIVTLVVAILAVSYVTATHTGHTHTGALDEATAYRVRMVALDHSVDQRLAIAIAYTENAQRPPWFRRLENLVGKIRKGGSYGLFQVSGYGPVDDIESCRIAMTRLQGSYPLLSDYGDSPGWSIMRCAELHNPDLNFAKMVADVYYQFEENEIDRTKSRAPDGRPVVTVNSLTRFGDTICARGTFWAPNATLFAGVKDSLGQSSALDIESSVIAGRSSWRVLLGADAVRFVLRVRVTRGARVREREFNYDLADIELPRDLTLRNIRAIPSSAAQPRLP